MKNTWVWLISAMMTIFFITLWGLSGVDSDTVLVGGSIFFLVVYFGLNILNELDTLKLKLEIE